MYASLVIYIAAPGSNEQMEKFAEQGPATLKGKKGFKSATYFSDKARNEYGMMTIWETKEDHDAFVKWGQSQRPNMPMSWFAGTLFESRTFYVNNFFSSQ